LARSPSSATGTVPGAFYDRKIAEGHAPREALRALKRRLSNVIYRQLVADAGRHR
jgi:transposase